MQAQVFWIPGPWQGRLGIVPRPRGGDWLGDETRAWRSAGIEVVVSLLEPAEEADLALGDEAAASAASGVKFVSHPIPDRGVPSSRESVARLAGDLAAALTAGTSVAIHCRQSIGRSALIAAAVLMAGGQDPDTAVEDIARSRGLKVPETAEQRRLIKDFASFLTQVAPARSTPHA